MFRKNVPRPEIEDAENDVLVKVKNVSKIFCRNLNRSLYYGVLDGISDLTGIRSRRYAPDGEPLLRTHEFWSNRDISFKLRRGECLGLIGHNGAGKTTLLKMLNGIIRPDVGSITMRGRVGALIALGAGFNPILTGRENIYVNGSVLGLTRQEIETRMQEIIDFAEIREFVDAPVQSYSSGMAVRLGFAIAAHCQPDILLLDEVLAVGDMGFQAKCLNKVASFREQGVAFILVSHNMHHIARYCDHVLYLNRGCVAHLGSAEDGIEQFLKDMDDVEADVASAKTDWSKVYGTGKAIFRKSTFLDKDGREIQSIRPGDTFTLAIDYECSKEDVDDAVLDVVIRDREGILFQGTSRDFGASFGTLSRSGRLFITFTNMPSNSSKIHFSFALLSARTAEVFDWKSHIQLSVICNPKLAGRIALDVEWQTQLSIS